MRLNSVEKDWKHVLMQKVVTLNTCCNIARLTFQLPHITTSFFSEPPMTAHHWFPSEPPALERTQQTFSQMKKFCISLVGVVTFSGGVGVGKWITVCFVLR